MAHALRHRGRHPEDEALFAAAWLPTLRRAVGELSWLFERGYSPTAALALVGNHHSLRDRQRLAVLRSAAADRSLIARGARRVDLAQVRGGLVVIDGLNCLITIEAALAGGVVLRGRDGVLRDLASVHGAYRRVSETETAVRAIGTTLAAAAPAGVQVFLDRPVSNSGRLRQLMEDIAKECGWPWDVRLADSPDRELATSRDAVIASGDAAILDRCGAWISLTAAVVPQVAPSAWILDLGVAAT